MDINLLAEELGTEMVSVIDAPGVMESLCTAVVEGVFGLFPIFAVNDEIAELLTTNF